MKLFPALMTISLLFITQLCFADMTVAMQATADGKDVGTIIIKESKQGLVFVPNLHDLPPGKHGFHVHNNPSCADQGIGAGDHYDPAATGKHLGPHSTLGHLGDLPVLTVKANGKANASVVAPKLKIEDIKNRSLIIHEGGDNYSDEPEILGGGGKRMVCGVIPES